MARGHVIPSQSAQLPHLAAEAVAPALWACPRGPPQKSRTSIERRSDKDKQPAGYLTVRGMRWTARISAWPSYPAQLHHMGTCSSHSFATPYISIAAAAAAVEHQPASAMPLQRSHRTIGQPANSNSKHNKEETTQRPNSKQQQLMMVNQEPSSTNSSTSCHPSSLPSNSSSGRHPPTPSCSLPHCCLCLNTSCHQQFSTQRCHLPL